VWSLRRRIDATRYQIPAEAYASADPEPSLGVLAFRVKDKGFPARAKEWSVVSPRTRREVPYSLWLQPGKAPIVFVIPGIGAHRRSTNPVALAELAHSRGYSVAVVSSPFHPEFILTGLTAVYPGYTPGDAEDLEAVLGEIRRQLDESRPGRVTGARLVGYSMGALESIFVAERDGASGGGLGLERVVLINPPVDLAYAAQGFDGYYDAPSRWPEVEREARIVELGMKAFLLAQQGIPEDGKLPLSRIESEFLIGLSGRTTIVNAISASEQRGGKSLRTSREEKDREGVLFSEINEGSVGNYGRELAVPYFEKAKGQSREALWQEANLRRHESWLRADGRVRAFTNRNDFILGAENLAWLEGVLGDRLVVFPDGGHLGNLYVPAVHEKILDALGPVDTR
jgi:pimeloyl-ACP methyl ester carboxylesterase